MPRSACRGTGVRSAPRPAYPMPPEAVADGRLLPAARSSTAVFLASNTSAIRLVSPANCCSDDVAGVDPRHARYAAHVRQCILHGPPQSAVCRKVSVPAPRHGDVQAALCAGVRLYGEADLLRTQALIDPQEAGVLGLTRLSTGTRASVSYGSAGVRGSPTHSASLRPTSKAGALFSITSQHGDAGRAGPLGTDGGHHAAHAPRRADV